MMRVVGLPLTSDAQQARSSMGTRTIAQYQGATVDRMRWLGTSQLPFECPRARNSYIYRNSSYGCHLMYEGSCWERGECAVAR